MNSGLISDHLASGIKGCFLDMGLQQNYGTQDLSGSLILQSK